MSTATVPEPVREILAEVEATLDWIAHRPFTEKERKAAEDLYRRIRRAFGSGALSAPDKPEAAPAARPSKADAVPWPPRWDRSPILPEETCTPAMARRVHEWAVKAGAKHLRSPIMLLESVLSIAVDRLIAADCCQDVCRGDLKAMCRVLGVACEAIPSFLESARRHLFEGQPR